MRGRSSSMTLSISSLNISNMLAVHLSCWGEIDTNIINLFIFLQTILNEYLLWRVANYPHLSFNEMLCGHHEMQRAHHWLQIVLFIAFSLIRLYVMQRHLIWKCIENWKTKLSYIFINCCEMSNIITIFSILNIFEKIFETSYL